jgi:hypothetical protein
MRSGWQEELLTGDGKVECLGNQLFTNRCDRLGSRGVPAWLELSDRQDLVGALALQSRTSRPSVGIASLASRFDAVCCPSAHLQASGTSKQ